jgi:thioredoxin 1
VSENVLEVTEENWEEEVLKSKLPVIVDFWAEWCAPCRMMAPIFEELSKEYTGKLKFAKLNTEQNQNIAMRYGIMSIPTLGIFYKGQPIGGIVGAVPKGYLKSQIDTILNKLNTGPKELPQN